MSKIPKQVSQYMSGIAKHRKNPHYTFKNRDLAKAAGDKGRETQRILREAKAREKAQPPTKSQGQSLGDV